MTEQDRKDTLVRLPEPDSDEDHKLRGYLAGILPDPRACNPGAAAFSIMCSIRSFLSRPATKEVEVWRVEWADGDDQPRVSQFLCKGGADDWVSRMPSQACARVTGPHKQTVPA